MSLFDEPAPAWAATLAGPAGDRALVARAVRLAASGWADVGALQRAVSGLLEAGRDPDVGTVLDAVARQARHPRRLADDTATTRAGEALVAVGARVVLAARPGYPGRLADAWPELGAPAWLFVRRVATAGPGPLPTGPTVAVVGTRRPSLDGLATARELGRRLARVGVTVVSGLARGIDQAAHRGALDAGGGTVAVLGTGLDVDYPKGDGALREAVAAVGGVVTEHPCGAPPRPAHFLARNRIIAGLADLTVVVEGRERSGALQTARLAAAQGREVWAVPGSVNAPTSRGPLALVRDGANVVTRLDDVVEAAHGLPGRDELPPDASEPPPSALSDEAATLRGLLSAVPASPNALAGASGLPLPSVLAAVSELVARGLATATPRGVAHPGGQRA